MANRLAQLERDAVDVTQNRLSVIESSVFDSKPSQLPRTATIGTEQDSQPVNRLADIESQIAPKPSPDILNQAISGEITIKETPELKSKPDIRAFQHFGGAFLPGQDQTPVKDRWEELINATARGIANVGSGFATVFGSEENGKLLWEVAKQPDIAATNDDLFDKAINIFGETIPYITATTIASIPTLGVGGFFVGATVEGNSAYRTALDEGVDEDTARKIGVAVGIFSGAVETVGGKFAGKLFDSATAKIKNKIIGKVAKFGASTLVEALEEGTQEIAALTGENIYRDVNWKEAVQRTGSAMIGGAFLGGVFKSADIATQRLIKSGEKAGSTEPQEIFEAGAEIQRIGETGEQISEELITPEVRESQERAIKQAEEKGLIEKTEPTNRLAEFEKEIAPKKEAKPTEGKAEDVKIERVATRIKATGEVVTKGKGAFHGDTDIKAIASITGETEQQVNDRIETLLPSDFEEFGIEHGFITSTGKFVNREDAGRIARKAKQVADEHKGSLESLQISTFGLGDILKGKLGRKLNETEVTKITNKSTLSDADSPSSVEFGKLDGVKVIRGGVNKAPWHIFIKPKQAPTPKAEAKAKKPKPAPKPIKADTEVEQVETEKTAKIQSEVSKVIETDFTKDATAAKQESVKADREALGLDVTNSKSRKSFEESLQQAKKEGVSKKASRIAAEIIEEPRALSDVETAGMTIRMAELKKEHAALAKEIAETDDTAELIPKAAEIQRVEDEFDDLTRAVSLSGTEKGRALVSQKLTINKDFDLISVLNRAKVAKRKTLSAREESKFKKLTEDLQKSNEKIDKLQLEVLEIQALNAVKKGAKRFTRMSLVQKDSDLSRLVAETNELLKMGCNN